MTGVIGFLQVGAWAVALILVVGGCLARLRPYRSLLWASTALVLITSVYPLPDNRLGQYLFARSPGSASLPTEIFGIAWWLIGAWLLNGVLDLILRRTLFPRDNLPHARRLFADLASVLFYVIAFVGIMETVMKQPISAVLATSGVLAIVLGLALQSTLGDVLSGLAINIDRPFGAGDWITLAGGPEGQVLEINWRSTRLRTWQNDVIVIPNSVVAKAIVTNHTRHQGAHWGTCALAVDAGLRPVEVIELIEAAINGVADGRTIAGATAYAADFGDGVVNYQVVYPVPDFGDQAYVRSEVIARLTAALILRSCQPGSAATRVQILPRKRAVPGQP